MKQKAGRMKQHKQQPSGLNTRQTYIKFSLKVNVGCFKVR